MIKAFIIPPAFRLIRIPGQVPTKEQVAATKLATAKPKKFDAAMLLNHTEPRLTVQSIVKGLGFDLAKASNWEKFLEKTMDTAPNELVLRSAVMEKCLEEKLDSGLKRALMQRSLVHWRSQVLKSMVHIVTPDEILEKAGKPATPEGGKTKAGYTVKIVGGKRQYVKEGEKKKKAAPEMTWTPTFGQIAQWMPGTKVEYILQPGNELVSAVRKKTGWELLRADGKSAGVIDPAAFADQRAGKPMRMVKKGKKEVPQASWGEPTKPESPTPKFKGKKGVAITADQLSLIQSLSADAKRTFNTMVDSPQYRGGLAATATKVELAKKGLVSADYNVSDPAKDRLILTDKGKKIAKKLRAMTPEDKREILFKAMARGGTYYRRVAKKSGKGHNYFYKPEDYNKQKDAHVNGDEAGEAYLSSSVLKCVEKAGDKGCDVASFKELVKKHGAKRVAASLKGGAGGKVEFKKGRFHMKKAKKTDKPKMVVKGK